MGLPTSAAYVLVAAVFAPALIQLGIEALKVHFFVLYYATLSVVTPPVCVGVFVAAQIAGAPWFRVAIEAMRLGAVAYALPMLFLAHDGFLGGGGALAVTEAVIAGAAFTASLAFLLGGRPAFGASGASRLAWAVPLVLSALPGLVPTLAAAAMVGILLATGRFPAREAAPAPAK